MCYIYITMGRQFSTFDITRVFGIPRSNIQQYMDRGFIKPSIESAEGKGTRNLFSVEDLYRLRIFQRLHAVGLSQKEASENSRLVDFKKIGKKGVNWIKITHEKEKTKIRLPGQIRGPSQVPKFYE